MKSYNNYFYKAKPKLIRFEDIWSLSKTIGTRVIKGHYLDYQICPQVSTAHIINLMRCQNYIILLYTIIDF